ncbi:MAG TPA: GDP-mannose 4,6-dehydratase, partial [Planctomycetaceae bacterium]|nr:GDP-mannose 4,6-dehydratase [Planctomycetaceae bacterium]
VLATGEPHSVREFVERAFATIGMLLTWRGSGLDEQGIDARGIRRVAIDSRYFRPTEVTSLLGDPSKARERLGWKHTIGFEQLVREMVQADRDLLRKTQSK